MTEMISRLSSSVIIKQIYGILWKSLMQKYKNMCNALLVTEKIREKRKSTQKLVSDQNGVL